MIALKYESINHRCAFYLKSWHGNKATRCITLQTAAFLSLRGDVFSPRSITECSGFSDSASHSSGGLSTTIQVWTGNEGRTMVSTLNHALKMPYAVGVRVLTGFSIVYTDSIYRVFSPLLTHSPPHHFLLLAGTYSTEPVTTRVRFNFFIQSNITPTYSVRAILLTNTYEPVEGVVVRRTLCTLNFLRTNL